MQYLYIISLSYRRQYTTVKIVPLVLTTALKLYAIISETVSVFTKNTNLNLIIFITGIKQHVFSCKKNFHIFVQVI